MATTERATVTGAFSSADDADLKAAIRRSESWAEVGAKVGRSAETAKQRAYGLARRGEIVLSAWAHITVSRSRHATKGRRWATTELADVRSMVGQGLTAAEIGARVRRTAEAVRCACRKHGIKLVAYPTVDGVRVANRGGAHPGWTADELRQARQMRREGATYQQIADMLGRSRRAVQSWLQRADGTSKKEWTPGEDARLKHLVALHLTYRQIAARLGRSPTSVKVRASRLGCTVTAMKANASSHEPVPGPQ